VGWIAELGSLSRQLKTPVAAASRAAVARSQGHWIEQIGAFFATGFEVDGDAEGRAEFFLAGIAAAALRNAVAIASSSHDNPDTGFSGRPHGGA